MNKKCKRAKHKRQKINTICLATQCQGNRVCCQKCLVQFHKDHIELLVSPDSLMEFIKTQGEQQDVVQQTAAYRQLIDSFRAILRTKLNYNYAFCKGQQMFRRMLELLCNQSHKKQRDQVLLVYNIGNQYKIQTEQIGIKKWNQLAQDMLSQVEIKNGEIIEKGSDVNQLGSPDQLFVEQFEQQMSSITYEFQNIQNIQQNIDPNQFMQLNLSHILEDHTNDVTGIDICETRNLLVSASMDRTVKLWDLQNFKLLTTYRDTLPVYDVIFQSRKFILTIKIDYLIIYF